MARRAAPRRGGCHRNGFALLSGSNHAVRSNSIYAVWLRIDISASPIAVRDRFTDVHRTAEHRRTLHGGKDKTLQRSIIYCNTVQRSKSCALKA